MYEYNERQDIWLFENDLAEYHASDEGIKVSKMLDYNDYDVLVRADGVKPEDLKAAFLEYWDARNNTGLHFSDEEKRKRGIAADKSAAEDYREQN